MNHAPGAPDNDERADSGHLRQVPPLAVIHEWPRVASLVRSALARGEGSYVEADVALCCIGGTWKLWLVESEGEVTAICITEIVNFPRRRKCLLRYLAGSTGAIEPHIPAIEDYARREGCQVFNALTRKGFVRWAPDWSQKYIIMEKEL